MKHKELLTLFGTSIIGSFLGIGALLGYRNFNPVPHPLEMPQISRTMSPILVRDHKYPTNQSYIVIFEDFECSPCQMLHRTLKEHPPKIPVFYRNFPLNMHKNAHFYAILAEAAREQGKFSEVSDFLFSSNNVIQKQDVSHLCSKFHLDEVRFKKSIETTGRLAVEQDQADGKQLGLRFTPTVVLVEENHDPKVASDVRDIVSYL